LAGLPHRSGITRVLADRKLELPALVRFGRRCRRSENGIDRNIPEAT
jgi:hypothetical protein